MQETLGSRELAFIVTPCDPMVCSEIMPGSPASTAVGMSGAATRRFALVTARMRSLPVRCSSRSGAVTAGVTIGTCPLIASEVAGPEPR